VLQGQRLGADMLADVQPYDPNLFVRGPHELLDRLARGGPADAVEMIGYVRTSSRVLLLSAVTIAPAG
jgi:hypothetical protein